MNVEGPTRARVSKYQTTRSVLVRWIVFDDFALCNGIADFLHTDLSEDTLVNRVLREFDPSGLELFLNGGKSIHGTVNRLPLQTLPFDDVVLLPNGGQVQPGHVVDEGTGAGYEALSLAEASR